MITCDDAYRRMTEREKIATFIEDRADRLEARFAPDRIQPHSRQLPTEEEAGNARFAARQLRIAAGEVRAGFDGEDGLLPASETSDMPTECGHGNKT